MFAAFAVGDDCTRKNRARSCKKSDKDELRLLTYTDVAEAESRCVSAGPGSDTHAFIRTGPESCLNELPSHTPVALSSLPPLLSLIFILFPEPFPKVVRGWMVRD